MGAELTFADARTLLPYLDRLGISHLYLSPIWRARLGSTHGYDVIDPNEIDPKLGRRSDLEWLSADARARGMGILCDIVPNHMAASWENPWWWDLLLHGHDSRFAHVFDIDWTLGDGKIVLPVLADELARVLDDLRVDGEVLRYHEHRFPLRGQRDTGLEALLEQQTYRLEHWRTARRNYRRFFDIDDLVAVDAEDRRTFALTHALVLDLLHSGTIDGIRVDHIDGLRDPAAYLRRVEASVPAGTYVVVEKILARGEALRDDWVCSGTTGYDFSDVAEAAFIDRSGIAELRRQVANITGSSQHFRTISRTAKREAVKTHFDTELDATAESIVDLTMTPRAAVRRGLLTATVTLPVYRTYVTAGGLAPADRDRIDEALRGVRDPEIGSLLRSLFTLQGPSGTKRTARLDVVSRWQHLCAPAAAKGVEDTAAYRSVVLISRNEVGSDPSVPCVATDDLHTFLMSRRASTMNASSTHDSKRGEDVRARIDVLSEVPDDWAKHVRRWMRMNARLRTRTAAGAAPDPTDELYLYQTLVGTWPIHASQRAGYARRVREHMRKAAREAKRRTSWIDPDERYETALDIFVRKALANATFRTDLAGFARSIAVHGAVNSLARLVVKVCAQGVPDGYQGAELWYLRLVDPDNRAPVDFDIGQRTLEELSDAFERDPSRLLREITRRWPDGRIKLFTTWRALTIRRDHSGCLAAGKYVPLQAKGRYRQNVVAFARRFGPHWAIACVPRLSTQIVRDGFPLGDAWKNTCLSVPDEAPQALVDAFTSSAHSGHTLPVANLLRNFPVAVLIGTGEQS